MPSAGGQDVGPLRSQETQGNLEHVEKSGLHQLERVRDVVAARKTNPADATLRFELAERVQRIARAEFLTRWRMQQVDVDDRATQSLLALRELLEDDVSGEETPVAAVFRVNTQLRFDGDRAVFTWRPVGQSARDPSLALRLGLPHAA